MMSANSFSVDLKYAKPMMKAERQTTIERAVSDQFMGDVPRKLLRIIFIIAVIGFKYNNHWSFCGILLTGYMTGVTNNPTDNKKGTICFTSLYFTLSAAKNMPIPRADKHVNNMAGNRRIADSQVGGNLK